MRSLLRTGYHRSILGATALSGAPAPADPYASILALFDASEPGEAWIVHEDYLFTDTACTTPVSAAGDEVQGWLGAKYGVKFTQSTAGRMPKYGRQPVGGWTQHCLQSGDLSNATWTKNNLTVTGGQADPDGGTNAWKITTVTNGVSTNISQPIPRGNGVHEWSVVVKADTTQRFLIGHYKTGSFSDNIVDLGTQTWVLDDVNVSKSIVDLGGGFYEITLTYTGAAPTTSDHYFGPIRSTGTAVGQTTAGDSVIVYQPMRSRGAMRPTYQERGALYEGPASGASVAALYFDGVSDSMVCTAIDFTSANELTVWLGWEKTGRVNDFGVIVESFTNGGFSILQNGSAAASATNNYWFRVQGTNQYEKYLNQALPPRTRGVVAMALDISAGASAFTNIYVSDEYSTYSAVTTASGTTPGTGNFGNIPLYIGARSGGTTLESNGAFIGALVVLGRAPAGTEFADIAAAVEGLS